MDFPRSSKNPFPLPRLGRTWSPPQHTTKLVLWRSWYKGPVDSRLQSGFLHRLLHPSWGTLLPPGPILHDSRKRVCRSFSSTTQPQWLVPQPLWNLRPLPASFLWTRTPRHHRAKKEKTQQVPRVFQSRPKIHSGRWPYNGRSLGNGKQNTCREIIWTTI